MQTTNTKIQNPKLANEPQVKGPEMNDRDRLNDLLATEKYLTDGLNTAVREASHDALHQTMMTILTESHQAARNLFNQMFKMGWYALEAEEQQKLDQLKKQFTGYESQFPFPTQTQSQ